MWSEKMSGGRTSIQRGIGTAGRTSIESFKSRRKPTGTHIQREPAELDVRKPRSFPDRYDRALRSSHSRVLALRPLRRPDLFLSGGPNRKSRLRRRAEDALSSGCGPQHRHKHRPRDSEDLR